jgi:hypothetical protein
VHSAPPPPPRGALGDELRAAAAARRFEFVLRTPLVRNFNESALKRSYGGNPCVRAARSAQRVRVATRVCKRCNRVA